MTTTTYSFPELLRYKAHLCLLLANNDEDAAVNLMDLDDDEILRRAKITGVYVDISEVDVRASGWGLQLAGIEDAHRLMWALSGKTPN